MIRISDVAEVLPGLTLQSRALHESEGTHQVILAKHLKEGQPYQYDQEDLLRLVPKRSPDKYLVNKGDVLFISRGVRNHAVVVESVPENTVASATLYILRVKDEIIPSYLAWCINQSSIQAEVTQVRTGAGTPIVQRKVFQEISIPLPSLEKQKQIAEFNDLMGKERKLREKLFNRYELHNQIVSQKIMEKINE